ncbi:CheR family methyltransferase [Pontibacter chitinilyticus]|uniref:CheR family methyltransferase n=1 Tax=Pontibacter chitinilyticus TaxID=2674989 RepID=UPI00321949AF
MAKSAKQSAKKALGNQGRKTTANELNVIGIGASAGGLQALDALFSSVPHDGVAYVIVQHLSSEHRSLLTDLLKQYSILDVLEAEQNMPVEVNKVYVIPNDKELTITENHLHLLDKTETGRSKTVDTFFTSLAADKKERAIGIILSGTGTDGTEGAVAIKKAGGIVLVQAPTTAKFDSMPLNAINTGFIDFILPPEQMPNEIFNYLKVKPLTNQLTELINSETESSFYQILEMVHDRTGIDFSNYKRPTIIRRISRRMVAIDISRLDDYLEYLNLHSSEVEVLRKEFLIGVTKFFRDEEAYLVLATKVIPALVDSKKPSGQLRIWVAGCSSGEEPYSIAILVREYMDKVKKELEVKIFASDIDRKALDFASKGIYPMSSLTEVSEERLNGFFVKDEGKYRITQRVQRMVIFAPHNVSNDPPFSRIDLVSCRNMLIYMNPVLQKKVIDKFHYSLLVGGFLFLGTSESIGDLKSFEEINKEWKIFRNLEPAQSLGIANTFVGTALSRRSPSVPLASFPRELSAKHLMQQSFIKVLSQTILEEYDYAAVYIDENYDVLHGTGKFKHYLDLPDHNFTLNLLKLVSQDLAVSLGSILSKVILDNKKVTAHGIQVRDGNTLRYINVAAKPYLSEKKPKQRFILVLFSEDQPRTPLEENQVAVLSNDRYEHRVQELEIELQYTKDDLQAVVEELEMANEELQSTNEELQSLNEELHTINTEHQYKIKALMELDDDLNNYFRSTDIGQIFVDRQLIIRKYTPAATHLINLIESDIGRSIYQISNNLRYNHMIEDIRHVITSTKTVEREVQDKRGIWYKMRILPYITQERRIDGAIILFVQISEPKTLHLMQTGILNSSPNAIMALKAIRRHGHPIVDFVIITANQKAQELFNRADASLAGQTLGKELPQLLEQDLFEEFVQVVETGQILNVEKQLTTNNNFWLQITAIKFDDGMVLTLHDVTKRKQYEQQLLQQQEEIKASAERFRRLLEAVPHITWTNKPNGENNSFNDQWYKYTGLTVEESAGWGWTKAFHPDDLEALLPGYEASLAEGKIVNVQARILSYKDNEYRWHLIKDVPIRNEQGEINLWVGTATDIQDQKEQRKIIFSSGCRSSAKSLQLCCRHRRQSADAFRRPCTTAWGRYSMLQSCALMQ